MLLIAIMLSSALPVFAAWHVLLDGVDVSGIATPLARGKTILVNTSALASVLHLQLTVRGDLVTIRDTHGNDWQTRDGGIMLLNDGRSLSLPYPLLLLDGNVYLPIETVNSLVDHHLVFDQTDEVTLTSENIGEKTLSDGWQAIAIPKPASPPGQPVPTTLIGLGGEAAVINLPPVTDHLRFDVGVGYVLGADMGTEFTASGACYGNELQMNSWLTRGAQGTQLNNGYLSLVNRETGHGIEIGNLSSDLLGGMDGARYSWRTGENRWPALSLYWDQHGGNLLQPIVSYRDDLTWDSHLSVGGEIDSQGEIELHSRYQPGSLGLYTDIRRTRDPAQSGASVFTTYLWRNGISVSGGMSRNGADASQADWSDMAVHVPLRDGFDVMLDHSRTQGMGTLSTDNAAMLTVPVGSLRVLTRLAIGQTENTMPGARSLYAHRDLMISTGYNLRPNLRADIQTVTRWQGNTVDYTSQCVGSYSMSSRSNIQLISSLPDWGSSDQFNLRWNYFVSEVSSFSLEYGQIAPLQNGGSTTEHGVMLMVNTHWGITTPARGASVTGMVRDETGHPLSDCLVRLGNYRTVTDSSGGYHFAHVPAGAYDIALDNSSLPANYQCAIGIRHFTVRDGDRITRDFRVIPLHALTGKVLLADGNGKIIAGGVGGVVLHLDDTATVTDAAGVFGFYNLAPGTYTVRLDTARLSSMLATVGATELTVILLPAGQTAELLFTVIQHDREIIYQQFPGSGK